MGVRGATSVSRLYFVATAHDEYRQRQFEPGDVVIDPWRMIPGRTEVKVRRLGQNRPALISLLMPSRGRPDGYRRVAETCFATATYPRQVELLVYLDDDDPQIDDYREWKRTKKDNWRGTPGTIGLMEGPRILLSEAWNRLAEVANGEIFMHCGDDLTFNTPGWDVEVRRVFDELPDKIAFAFADDLSTNFPDLGTHGFLHRRWVDAVGYFLPPLFSCDWNDVWLTEVAKMVKRVRPLPEVVIEHHHYSFGKAERDQTHAEREERGARDDVVNLYKRTQRERESDAAKLKAVMA